MARCVSALLRSRPEDGSPSTEQDFSSVELEDPILRGVTQTNPCLRPFVRDGSEIATSTPDEMYAIMQADYAKYGALIKSLNLKESP
jgi:hypothetical protein